MLEADEEYIALVSCHLTPEQLIWWVKTDASDWNAFYCFLEKQAKEASQIQVLQNTTIGCKTLWLKALQAKSATQGQTPQGQASVSC